MLLAVVIPWARARAPHVLRASAVIAQKVHAPRLAVILESRAGTTSAVAGRIVGVLGAMAFLVAAVASGPTSPSLSGRYVETITFGTDANPRTAIDYYRAIDGVGTVVVGTMHNSNGIGSPILINPADLSGVDETLRGLLLRYPTAVIGGCGSAADNNSAKGFVPTGNFLLDNRCGAYVNDSAVTFPTNGYGLLVYAAPGVDTRAVATRLNNNSPQDAGITFSGYSGAGSSGISWVGTLVEVGMLVILVIVPMAALSVGVARRRRRDDATLAALGAQPRTLRAAVIVEATVIAAFSIAVGLGWGALAHVLATVNFARTSLSGVITDSYLHWTLSSIAWVPLLVIGACSVVVFGAAAAIAARALQRRTPVENHRPVSSGVLS
jgi:ABC-type antimicrobial peptide transport system permease subunit